MPFMNLSFPLLTSCFSCLLLLGYLSPCICLLSLSGSSLSQSLRALAPGSTEYMIWEKLSRVHNDFCPLDTRDSRWHPLSIMHYRLVDDMVKSAINSYLGRQYIYHLNEQHYALLGTQLDQTALYKHFATLSYLEKDACHFLSLHLPHILNAYISANLTVSGDSILITKPYKDVLNVRVWMVLVHTNYVGFYSSCLTLFIVLLRRTRLVYIFQLFPLRLRK
nr:MAG: putative glycoprotein 1 [Wufeng rodent arterivirus 2]